MLAFLNHKIDHLIIVIRMSPGLRVIAHSHLRIECLNRDGIVQDFVNLPIHHKNYLFIQVKLSYQEVDLIIWAIICYQLLNQTIIYAYLSKNGAGNDKFLTALKFDKIL